MERREFLPNRINFDAIVFCGCTMKEMQVIAILSLLFVTIHNNQGGSNGFIPSYFSEIILV